MKWSWLLAPLALLAGIRPLRRARQLAGVSALASVAIALARDPLSSVLRASDPLVGAALRLAVGSPARTHFAGKAEIRIAIDAAPRARVDERFLSVAIDSSLVVGGHWWSPDGHVEPGIGRTRVAPFEFGSARLRDLARALAPAYLRIGGTEADRIYYGVEEPAVTEPPAPYDIALRPSQWQGLTDFTRDTGLDLFFTLNAGPSSRDADGRWQPDNAEHLLRHARARGDRIAVLELGNEINAYWFAYGLRQQPDGATVATDAVRLRLLARRYFPDALLVGPGEFFWPTIGSPFATKTHVLEGLLAAGGGQVFDALTWHYYPQQSRRCPIATRRASTTELLEPACLDELSHWAGQIEGMRDTYARGLPIWLGETGHAQCGGEPIASDRFVSSLWWMDQLGLLATRGQPIAVRQALVGSNYGLLDDTTFEPRPDYFASLLWKRLMGSVVLGVARDNGGDPFVRTYAHCTPARTGEKPGSLTLLAINLHPNQSASLQWPAAAGAEAHVYQVTAPELTSSHAFLNGSPMSAPAEQPLLLEPMQVRLSGDISLAPASYTFVVVPADARSCM